MLYFGAIGFVHLKLLLAFGSYVDAKSKWPTANGPVADGCTALIHGG
jgi:hypothetical protein